MIKLTCVGNLVRDPESRTIQKGDSDGQVCNFTVAASYGYGEYRRTEFVRVAACVSVGNRGPIRVEFEGPICVGNKGPMIVGFEGPI